ISNTKPETETRRTCRREIPLGFAAPDHTVPCGTVLSRDAFPGTSCQATIGVVPPGRAGRHFATASSESLLRIVPEGRCDRSLARSAWKNATQKSRPAGYGMIRVRRTTRTIEQGAKHLQARSAWNHQENR